MNCIDVSHIRNELNLWRNIDLTFHKLNIFQTRGWLVMISIPSLYNVEY